MSSIQEVERELALQDAYLPKKVETPISSGYRPELDFSPELEGSQVNYFQGLIGVLRWIVELGRIDLIVPVSLLSRFMASPREGHLQQCYHIFAYLKQFNRSRLVFDDGEPTFEDSYFHVCDWSEYYPDAQEPIPPNRCLSPLDTGFLLRVLLTPNMLVAELHDDLRPALLFMSTKPQLFGIPNARILWSLQLLAPNLSPLKPQLIISMVCAIN
jgi:hypothetical protein